MSYSSLHNHSEFSFLDGFASVEEYLQRASSIGLKAVALTEHGNFMSAPYIHKAKKNYPDLKIIYGCEFYECADHNVKNPDSRYWHLVLLAKNEAGRIAINELITKGEFEGKYYGKPRVDLQQIRPYADNLVCTTACLASKLSRIEDYDKCIEFINEYKSVFCNNNFFLEMQAHRSDDQRKYNQKILQLSKDTNTPYIITTDSHAATAEQLEYQAIWVGVAHDSETLSESYEGCYMQSEFEIHTVMDGQIGANNVDIGLDNTNLIADMIEDVQMPFQNPKLPSFKLPEGYTERSYIEKLLAEGWTKRGFDSLPEDKQKIRRERLDEELNVIDKMGFIGYFLIENLMVRWGKKNNILFGPGRGSAAGALLCYLLEITEVDPVEYDLIFSRFLNEERKSLPDIDTDLYPKDRVIKFLQEEYGQMSVCQIANISYSSPNVSVKDTIRILDRDPKRFEKFGKKIGTQKAFEIAKLFTHEKWEDCIAANGQAINKYSDEIYKDVFRIAEHLSGRAHHISIHAGGVGIVNEEITDYMPMRLTDKGEQVIQVDKKIVEEIGIVKYDLLSLSNLSIIKEAKEIAGIEDWEINPNNPEFLKDEMTFDLLCKGDTGGIFQLESVGMTQTVVGIQPRDIRDVCLALALYRPDTMGMLEEFIARRQGKSPVSYMHPDMEPILKETLGIQAYQEQTLQIVRTFGGWSFGKADLFRRAIGKKIPEEIKRLVDELRGSIIENGYSEETADEICTLLRDKGGYEFNKSHSLSYSVLSMQTAYLKAHYPTAFYCATLNACEGDNGKINKKIVEAQAHDIDVLPPSINSSSAQFSVVDNKILFGLSAVTGVGGTVVEKIIEERNNNGPFSGIVNFSERVSEVNTAQIVSLIKAGAFGQNKSVLLEKFLKHTVKQKYVDKTYKEYKPVKSLPSLLVLKTEYGIETKDKDERVRLYNEARRKEHETTGYEKWKLERKEKMQKEFDELWEKYSADSDFYEFQGLNVFLTDNPFTEIHKYIQRPFGSVDNDCEFFSAGIISSIQKKKDKNKRQMAYVSIYSVDGIIEGTCFASSYEKFINVIAKGQKVAVFGVKQSDSTFVLKNIETLDDWMRRSNIRIGGKK